MKHGTVSAYQRGCRCARCTAARRAYDRRRYHDAVERYAHGTLSRYKVGKCRCAECEAAYEANRDAYRERRRAIYHEKAAAGGGIGCLPAAQRRVMLALGGRTMTADDLAEELGGDRHAVLRRLHDLLRTGLVEQATPARGTWPAEWRRVALPQRRCAHHGCDTILSRYNLGDYCAAHEAEHIDHRAYLMEVAV